MGALELMWVHGRSAGSCVCVCVCVCVSLCLWPPFRAFLSTHVETVLTWEGCVKPYGDGSDHEFRTRNTLNESNDVSGGVLHISPSECADPAKTDSLRLRTTSGPRPGCATLGWSLSVSDLCS